MPLFFASNAIYPIELMPEWLQATALANPLNYLVDALRGLMVVGGESVYGVATDLGALFVWTFVLILVASRLSGRIGR